MISTDEKAATFYCLLRDRCFTCITAYPPFNTAGPAGPLFLHVRKTAEARMSPGQSAFNLSYVFESRAFQISGCNPCIHDSLSSYFLNFLKKIIKNILKIVLYQSAFLNEI